MKNWITLMPPILVIILTFSLNLQAQPNQQITFGSLPSKTFGDLPFNLEASASSGLPVQFTSSNPSVASISGSTLTIVSAGEAVITANQSGDANFNAAPAVQQTLVVAKANQTITFLELPIKTYGDGTFPLTASASSNLTITYSSSNTSVASIVGGNFVVINGAGECTITANQEGNSNYNAALPVARTLTVNKATQNINFNALTNKTYGDAPYTLVATATSGLAVVFTSSNTSLLSITGNQATILGAGTVEIIASQSGNNNYLPAENKVRSQLINKAVQSITFSTISTKTYGDLPFALTATASSGLPVSFSSELTSFLTIDGNIATIVGAGTLKVFASQSGNENYLPNVVEQTLTINKAPQAITFGVLTTKKFGDYPFTLSATATSGLPLAFNSSRKTVARISGNIVTIVAAGTTQIVASQAGNANYLAASNVTQQQVVTTLGNSYPLLGTARTGANGRGAIFNLNSNGTSFTLQKNFNPNAFNGPQSGLIKGSDGKLYGMIMAGGNPSNGIVFSILPDGTSYIVLHNFNFTNGQRPFGNVMEASNGYLYGMTYDGGVNNTGVLFRIKKDGSEFSKLFEFPNAGVNGYHPLGGLLEATNGDLYGMTAEGGVGAYGVVFTIKKDGSSYTKLLDLNGTTKGGSPRGNLIQGPDQYLYGTTTRGGSSNMGVLFKVKTDGSNYINLVEFDGTLKGNIPGSSPIIGTDGRLYGTTRAGGVNDLGVIYSVNTNGTGFTKLFDFDGSNSGSWGLGELVQSSDGFLYGMTFSGGTSDLGTAFKIKNNGTEFTKLLNFTGANGANPVSGNFLEFENGKFAAMTSKGGSSNSGVIFSMTADGTFAILKDFPQPEGTPEVISSGTGNNYFGVASSGGSTGNGAIFKTAADGSGYEKILDLEGDVLFVNKLIHTSDDKIWGSGREGVFTVTPLLFRLNPDGSDFERIVFSSPDATNLSLNQLIEIPGQLLVGSGYSTGTSTHGIIFRFKTDGTDFVKVADIPGGDNGSRPVANLIRASDGNIYGLTQEGGNFNSGAIFKVDGTTNQYTKIFNLNASTTGTGASPKKIIELNDGSLCVITASGALNNYGSIFSVSPDGTDYYKIYDFTSSAYIPTDLIQTGDGYLMGTTESGGLSNNGIIFEMLTDGSNYKKAFEFNGTNGASPNSLFFRKQDQTITFNGIAPKQYNDPTFQLIAINSSGLQITFTSSNEDIATISGNTVTIHGVGEVTITASAGGNINFSPAAQVQRTLVVNKDDQILTFNELVARRFNDPPVQLTATSNQNFPVTFTSSNEAIASISGTTLTIHSVGAVTITASAPGNAHILPAEVQRTLTVSKDDQTISFSSIADRLMGSGSFNLTATSSSGLTVTFSTSSGNISIAGNVVTSLNPGTVTVYANQPGNALYEAATTIAQTFCINPIKPTITSSEIGWEYLLTSNYQLGNQWYKNGTALSGETANTLAIHASGSYSVIVTIGGCTSVSSDARILVITSTDEEQKSKLSIYPNPAQGKIKVDIGATLQGAKVEIEIIDISGKKMKQFTSTIRILEIDIAEFPTGHYILKMTNGTESVNRHFLRK